MNAPAYPLLFEPVYKDYVWGGNRIPHVFDRPVKLDPCAESWEVADRPEGMSVVRNGPLAGTSLRELIDREPAAVLGRANAERFPLLVKLIDARERLSVQVHPDDESAARYGGEAKTEMWYILDADPEACVYAGLQPGVTPEDFRAAIADNTVEDRLRRFPVSPGDVIFTPGGRIHAIGAGCLLLEVQQNSDTTYRVYDWGRVGKDGKPRELHVEDAMRAIDWDDPEPAVTRPGPIHEGADAETRILDCEYFRIRGVALERPRTLAPAAEGCTIVFVERGAARAAAGGTSVDLPRGTTCLLPAALDAVALHPAAEGTQLVLIDDFVR